MIASSPDAQSDIRNCFRGGNPGPAFRNSRRVRRPHPLRDLAALLPANEPRPTRLLLECDLWPVQGVRFQPTGFPDLGAYESSMDKLASDPGWLTLLDSTDGCFVEDAALTQSTVYGKLA